MDLKYDTPLYELREKRLISVRSFNACSRCKIFIVKELLEFYYKNGSFDKIEYLGEKSNSELISFCEFAKKTVGISQGENFDIPLLEETPPARRVYSTYLKLDIQKRDFINKIYSSKTKGLSVRAQNILLTLDSGNNLERILEKVDFANYDLTKFRNAGAKTIDEINDLLGFLMTLMERNDEGFGNVVAEEQIKIFIQQLSFTAKDFTGWIEPFVRDNFDKLSTGDFPLLLLIENLLKNTDIINQKHRDLFLEHSNFFIGNTENSKDVVAESLGLSKERIRQILVDDQFYAEIFDRLTTVFQVLEEYHFVLPTKFKVTGKVNTCNFENINAGTNFSNKFFSYFLPIVNPLYSRLAVEIEDHPFTFLISKQITESVNLIELIAKIEEIREAKIEEDFEISFLGFVNLYRQNQDKYLEDEILKSVEQVIFELFGLYPDFNGYFTIKRNAKRKVWEYVYKVLLEEGKPMHIKDISKKLAELKMFVDPQGIRSTALRLADKFVLTGSSIYGLKEWETSGAIIGGTIKQLIEKYLEGFDTPKHLYEIACHVKQQRDTNMSSVHGNLQQDPLNRFTFFGGNFYGLTGKVYENPTPKYKPVGRHWFKDVKAEFAKSESQLLSRSTIIDYIAKLYDVKEAQVEFLLEQRIEKGELAYTTDNLLKLT